MDPSDWTLTGNAKTDPSINFLGTTDENPLVIKTQANEAIRINPDGKVGIGLEDPHTQLHVLGQISTGLGRTSSAGTITFFAPDGFTWFHIDNGPAGGRPLGRLRISHGGHPGEYEIMSLDQHGNVGIGTPSPQAKLHVNGHAKVGVLEITGGGDLAEPFPVESHVEPGTVMVIDENRPGNLRISDSAYDRKVAGIVSGANGVSAGLTLQDDFHSTGNTLVALVGRVYCKAEAHSSTIQPGDFLTTSSLPGHAMKAVDGSSSYGAIIGKAMTTLLEGTGLVLVLVNLQ